MNIQKNRSKSVKNEDLSDWIIVNDKLSSSLFVGYDNDEVDGRIIKFRESKTFDGKVNFHIVLDKTVFYPEGGGQVGDSAFLDSKFNFGIDYQDTKSDSEYTLYGRNDDNDPYSIAGAYAQGQSKLSDNLTMTYAARIDKYNFIDEAAFAPKLAFVYKLNDSNSVRVSASRGTYGPSALETYIDFPVRTLSAGQLDVWLSGQIEPHVFDQNSQIEVTGAGADVPGGAAVKCAQRSHFIG